MKTQDPATIEDLLRTPEDGRKYELVDGRILVSPGGTRHSKVGSQILHLLKLVADPIAAGETYGPDLGVLFSNGNVRSPDVCFVRRERLPADEHSEGFLEVIPDLVVEVLSPNDRMRQVAEKIGDFLDWGVQMVWLVDPRARTVTVYRSLTDTQKLREGDTITAEPILPEFAVAVEEFFR